MSLTGLPYLLPRNLTADPFGPNPLVTDLSVTQPEMFHSASEREPAPTLFATGDLPPFTASGVDPHVLDGLPYHWRHAAAATPDPGLVLAWLEEGAQDRDPMGRSDGKQHPGLMDYQQRMQTWVAGLTVADVSLDEAFYPDGWKSASQRRAELDAAAAEQARTQQESEAQQNQDAIRMAVAMGDVDKVLTLTHGQVAAGRGAA